MFNFFMRFAFFTVYQSLTLFIFNILICNFYLRSVILFTCYNQINFKNRGKHILFKNIQLTYSTYNYCELSIKYVVLNVRLAIER